MPELPEVERERARIESGALHRTISCVDDADVWVARPHLPGDFDSALVGRALVAAHRRGKTMWCETSDHGPVLGIHLGMSGRIVLDAEPAQRRWDRFTVHFADGGSLALRDQRRLSRVRLDPELDALGPDAADIDRAAFRCRVGQGRAPIKARLLDQGVLAGVGNLLADESLWQAGLDPRRTADELAEADLDALRRQLRAAIRRAIRHGGVHTGEFVGERHRGGHCPRCGAELQRGTVAGRTTWWCPREQR